jgi:hypothetical protein
MWIGSEPHQYVNSEPILLCGSVASNSIWGHTDRSTSQTSGPGGRHNKIVKFQWWAGTGNVALTYPP